MPGHEGWREGRRRALLADHVSAERRSARPRFDVVGFGALNLDHLYRVPQLIRDGGVEVLSSTAQPGGSAANTVYGLAKLGLRCGFVGVVGDDDAGKAILRSFEEVGVDTGGILVKPGASTGQTICITAGEGQKAIYIIPGANTALQSRDVDLSCLSDARHVHLSSFVGEAPFSQQLQVVSRLPPQIRVSLALDDVYARHGLLAVTPFLRRCAVLFANAEELRELTGRELRDAADACLDTGCEAVVATFGGGQEPTQGPPPPDAEASIIFTRRRTGRAHGTVEYAVPAIRTHRGPVVDTVGAGDAFAAGFLFGLLSRRFGPAKCGALGHTTAEFSLTELGARKGLPTREELLARFDESFGPVFHRQRRRGRALSPTQTE
jgi:ribokinase